MKSKKYLSIAILAIILVSVISCTSSRSSGEPAPVTATASATTTPLAKVNFNGEQALKDVQTQEAFGPRLPDSAAHAQTVDWIQAELKAADWQTEVQDTTAMGHTVRNIIARRGEGKPWIILGAHYDTRMHADQDPNPANHTKPVPGANDGASGVAVLLELARTLPTWPGNNGGEGDESAVLIPPRQIWLVFFDAEDNGQIPGWDWILGSKVFVASLKEKPDAAVIVDMIGDANLNIYREKNSDTTLTDEIWMQAAKLGYSSEFITQEKYQMLDDHLPFRDAGIPAVDLIDFDYPYWHTVADTADKVSAGSLQAVGDTLLAWLVNRRN